MGIIIALIAFNMMILIHELGHLIAAKKTGMNVKEFAIGFGPRLISKEYKGTLYSFRLLPLGGFNDIKINHNVTSEGDFYAKPLRSRLLVLVMGSVFNLVSAWIAIFLMLFLYGAPTTTPIIKDVVPDKPAYTFLQENDKIISLNGNVIKDNSIDQEMYNSIKTSDNVNLIIERNGKAQVFDIPKGKNDVLGVRFDVGYKNMTAEDSFFGSTLLYGNYTGLIINSIRDIFTKEDLKVTESVGGPVGMGKAMYDVNNDLGMFGVLMMFAIVSINLGIFNLLPLPILDGGHIAVQLMERIRNKPFTEPQIKAMGYFGMAVLGGLFLLGTYSDFMRILFSN